MIFKNVFSEVFKAQCRETKRIVALKKILMENEKEGVLILILLIFIINIYYIYIYENLKKYQGGTGENVENEIMMVGPEI